MSELGYLVLVALAVLAATMLRLLLASRPLRGRPISDLASLFPQLGPGQSPDQGQVQSQGNRWGKAAIYCYSRHCGPCRRLTPAIDTLREAHPNLLKLDVAEHPAEARRLGIQVTPTILLVEHGRVLKAIVGAQGLAAVKVFLDSA